MLALFIAAALQTPATPPSPAVQGEVLHLQRTLHLTGAQVTLAGRYVAALRSQPDEPAADVAKLDPVSYLRTIVAGLRKDIQIVGDAADAAQAFSASLAPDQRSLWVRAWLRGAAPAGATPPSQPVLQSHAAEGEETAPEDLMGMVGYVPPEVITLPTGEQLERLYPHAALVAGMTGVTRLRCATDLDGYLVDCTVVQEAPIGLGFGNAALQATAWYRLSAARRHGLPVRGEITVPIRWAVSAEDPPSAAQDP